MDGQFTWSLKENFERKTWDGWNTWLSCKCNWTVGPAHRWVGLSIIRGLVSKRRLELGSDHCWPGTIRWGCV